MKVVSKQSSKPSFISPTKNNNKYEGSQYAIKVSGGFQIADSTKTMHIHTAPNIAKYDITDALQIAFPAKVLNSLLLDDKIYLSSQILLEHLTRDSILSFGVFENLHSKYESFITGKIGHIFNTSLFSSNVNFDKHVFYELLTSNMPTESIAALSGEIRVLDVKQTVNNLQKWNVFGNRTQQTTAEFIRGDFFFMNDGFSVTLKTDLSIQPMYVSLINADDADKNENEWKKISEKTYTANLLIFLV